MQNQVTILESAKDYNCLSIPVRTMPSPATLIFSLKIIIITAGVVSIAMALNFSVPLIMGFCLNDVPILWNSLQTWLKPPYLCFIINGIIISIAASSWFSNHNHNNQVNTPAASQPVPMPLPMITIRTTSRPSGMVAAVVVANETPAEEEEVYMDEEAEVVDIKPVVVNGINQLEAGDDSYPHDDDDPDNDDYVANEDAWIVPKSDFTPSQENPPILSPFGHRIKPAKTKPGTCSTTPEGGRAVTVVGRSRQHQNDTLENTWKKITEGRHVPRTRQLKRSDSWQNDVRDVMVVNSVDLDLSPAPRPPHALKSASFREVTSYRYHHCVPDTPPDEIRKEPSLSLDEQNRRFEEFIQKFNEDMRLQRQESLNKYLEMINRGAH